MLWQRGTSNDKVVWIAVGPDGKRVKNDAGKYTVRYDPLAGAAYYNPARAKLDPEAAPEKLPDGWPADSPEGNIVRFCFTDEAKRDWAFLDAWQRRQNRSLVHAGCGDPWADVPVGAPMTCSRCGRLRGDDTVYAQWYTVKDPAGESVKVCVAEAWITGKRDDYLAGRRPVPTTVSASPTHPAASPAPREETLVEEAASESGTAGRTVALVLVGLAVLAAIVAVLVAVGP